MRIGIILLAIAKEYRSSLQYLTNKGHSKAATAMNNLMRTCVRDRFNVRARARKRTYNSQRNCL